MTAAYQAGELAFHEGSITAEAWHLYDKLVFWSGMQGYCWYKVATIAEMFCRSVRHVGRWLKELVDAGLIRRERRAHGAALTHITALGTDRTWMSDRDETPMSDRSFKEETLKDQEAGRPKAADPSPPIEPIELPRTSQPDLTPGQALARSFGVRAVASLGRVSERTVQERVDALNARGTDWGPGLLWTVLHDVMWEGRRRRRAAPKREPTIDDLARSVDATQEQETAEHDAYYARLLANPDYCATCGTYTCGQCEHAGDG